MAFDVSGFGLLPVALGAVVGIILSLTGAGGGILAVPLLVFGLHLPMREASPVGLIAVGAAAAIGAILGLRDGSVRYRAAAMIGVTGMVLAPLGVWLSHRIPNAPLQIAFALLLAWIALRMFRQSLGSDSATDPSAATAAIDNDAPTPVAVARPCLVDKETARLSWTLPCARALAGTGAMSGVLSGLLGVGGGFVIVPSLNRVTDLPMRSISATSLAVIALVSVGGVTAAARQGAIDWPVAVPFALGAVIALLIGRRIASRLAGPRLQQAFAGISAVVAVLLILRASGLLGA